MKCAIYTRKSSEEGLEQDFNSLTAQREACEAYVTSQRSQSWRALKARYDDGGFSGGTLERPGLKRLLDHIDTGRIQVVVVYKIDRLTRSLADFDGARLLREWGSKTHEVTVTDCGFTYRGKTYKSLSAIAREITGSRWSGPAFFGLTA